MAAKDWTRSLKNDGMEDSARANFDALEAQTLHGSQRILDRGGRGYHSDEEIDELFSDLLSTSHTEPPVTVAPAPATQKGFQHSPALREEIKKTRANAQRYYEENLERIRKQSAREQRQKYALEKAAEGKSVRTYKFHSHKTPDRWESHDDRERRLHRERARTYRGVTPEAVRKYTDLSLLSQEDRLQYLRNEAARRKRESRARQKALKTAS